MHPPVQVMVFAVKLPAEHDAWLPPSVKPAVHVMALDAPLARLSPVASKSGSAMASALRLGAAMALAGVVTSLTPISHGLAGERIVG